MSQKDWSFDEQRIQICYGLTEKQNFCAFLTHMLLFELEVLN